MSKPIVKHNHPEMRYMNKADMPEVLAIDDVNNQWDGWSEELYLKSLRRKTTIGMVCAFEEKVAGFIIYDFLLEEEKIFILKFEVSPPFLLSKVPATMIEEMKNKVKLRKLKRIEVVYPDKSEYLPQHNFWKRFGWKVTVEKNFFAPEGVDGYKFTWNYDKKAKEDDIFKSDFDV